MGFLPVIKTTSLFARSVFSNNPSRAIWYSKPLLLLLLLLLLQLHQSKPKRAANVYIDARYVRCDMNTGVCLCRGRSPDARKVSFLFFSGACVASLAPSEPDCAQKALSASTASTASSSASSASTASSKICGSNHLSESHWREHHTT